MARSSGVRGDGGTPCMVQSLSGFPLQQTKSLLFSTFLFSYFLFPLLPQPETHLLYLHKPTSKNSAQPCVFHQSVRAASSKGRDNDSGLRWPTPVYSRHDERWSQMWSSKKPRSVVSGPISVGLPLGQSEELFFNRGGILILVGPWSVALFHTANNSL